MLVQLGFSYHAKYTARLAQSVEHETLNLRVVGSSPTLGEQFFLIPSDCDSQEKERESLL